MKLDFDVIIVGSGVAGMTAAIYLKRANISCCIIEKYMPGGQIMKTSTIENYPGLLKITGPDLAMNMVEQLKTLDVPYIYDEVIDIKDKQDYKIVKTNQKELSCKGIILALGRTPRKLNVPGEDILEGRGISWCAICDGPLYKNLDVLVIGGGNSSLEEAIYLSEICQKVTVVHRKDNFKAQQYLIDKVKAKNNIKVLFNAEVKEFIEKEGRLKEVLVFNNKTNKTKKLKASGCFIYIGHIPSTTNFSSLNILDEDGYIKTDSSLRTEVPFIYAAGDVVKKSLYQIVTATNDGALAASSFIEDFENK